MERNLTFNQFVSVKDLIDVDVQLDKGAMFAVEG